jgi:hypothetical protein
MLGPMAATTSAGDAPNCAPSASTAALAAPAGDARHGVPGTDPSASGGGPALFLDTWTANADQLRAAGVPAAQIHVLRACTSCHRDVFHSYRVDGERAGRMIGVIRAKGK